MKPNSSENPKIIVVKEVDVGTTKPFSPKLFAAIIVVFALLLTIFSLIAIFTNLDANPLFFPVILFATALVILTLIIVAIVNVSKGKNQ